MARKYSLTAKSRDVIEKSLVAFDKSLFDAGISHKIWDSNELTLAQLQRLADHLEYILRTKFYDKTAEISPVGGCPDWIWDKELRVKLKSIHEPRKRIPVSAVEKKDIRAALSSGEPISSIAKRFKRSLSTISEIKNFVR